MTMLSKISFVICGARFAQRRASAPRTGITVIITCDALSFGFHSLKAPCQVPEIQFTVHVPISVSVRGGV